MSQQTPCISAQHFTVGSMHTPFARTREHSKAQDITSQRPTARSETSGLPPSFPAPRMYQGQQPPPRGSMQHPSDSNKHMGIRAQHAAGPSGRPPMQPPSMMAMRGESADHLPPTLVQQLHGRPGYHMPPSQQLQQGPTIISLDTGGQMVSVTGPMQAGSGQRHLGQPHSFQQQGVGGQQHPGLQGPGQTPGGQVHGQGPRPFSSSPLGQTGPGSSAGYTSPRRPGAFQGPGPLQQPPGRTLSPGPGGPGPGHGPPAGFSQQHSSVNQGGMGSPGAFFQHLPGARIPGFAGPGTTSALMLPPGPLQQEMLQRQMLRQEREKREQHDQDWAQQQDAPQRQQHEQDQRKHERWGHSHAHVHMDACVYLCMYRGWGRAHASCMHVCKHICCLL